MPVSAIRKSGTLRAAKTVDKSVGLLRKYQFVNHFGPIFGLSAAQVDARADRRTKCLITGYISWITAAASAFSMRFPPRMTQSRSGWRTLHGETVKELWCGGRRVKQWSEDKAA